MNYDFYLDITEPVLLKEGLLFPEDSRPHVGDIISIRGHPNKKWDIMRSVPTNNPSGEKVSFYVLPHVDKVTRDNPQVAFELGE